MRMPVWMMMVWGLAMAQDKTSSMLTNAGILQVNSNTNVIVVRDSVLVTMIYDMNDVELMWNNYIESVESLISNLGQNKFKIKEFLRLHGTKAKSKRQAF